jgi:hypothetical protein
MRVYLGVCLKAFCELTWERIVKQAGSVCEGMLERVHERILRAWEHTMKCIWQFC